MLLILIQISLLIAVAMKKRSSKKPKIELPDSILLIIFSKLVNIVHEDEKLKVGMTFSYEEEFTKYYKNYARCMGFGVSKISSKNADLL